jgi:hypothetical protein
MRVTHQLHRALATVGFAALLTGCRDDVVAPSLTERPSPISVSLSTVTAFVYDPAVARSFDIGQQHRISFSAGAVCDPLVSTYGPGEWDAPCTPLATPIVITARSYVAANGHPRVDFTPSLRFVPGSEVVLYLRDKAAADDASAVIQWCDDAGQCVTEAAPLPSYETKRDQALGMVFRAIKHFSGYMIQAGRAVSPG